MADGEPWRSTTCKFHYLIAFITNLEDNNDYFAHQSQLQPSENCFKTLYTGEYTPIGKVIYGLDTLTKIKAGSKSEYVLRPNFINYFASPGLPLFGIGA